MKKFLKNQFSIIKRSQIFFLKSDYQAYLYQYLRILMSIRLYPLFVKVAARNGLPIHTGGLCTQKVRLADVFLILKREKRKEIFFLCWIYFRSSESSFTSFMAAIC